MRYLSIVLRRTPSQRSIAAVRRIVTWYFEHVYGRVEGPGTTPFYCDPTRVGHFAVSPNSLAEGDHESVFRVLLTISMYQARRDQLVMAQQRAMPSSLVAELTSPGSIGKLRDDTACTCLEADSNFESSCSVFVRKGRVDCAHLPVRKCPVKVATQSLRRTATIGKLPMSAWRQFGAPESFSALLDRITVEVVDPGQRAVAAVRSTMSIGGIGEKLATLFVSLMCTPALAPGLTPWSPRLDGNRLVVVDTNVARAVRSLGIPVANTYGAKAELIRRLADGIPLTSTHKIVPSTSPRLVQQALYYFASKSNRRAIGLECGGLKVCRACAPASCLSQL
jgi:hypothetical protein